MSELRQVFQAPGDGTCGPLARASWVYDRAAIVPLWIWYAILREAQRRDAWAQAQLVEISLGTADRPEGEVHLALADADRLTTFLGQLAAEFSAGMDVSSSRLEYELTELEAGSYADVTRAVTAIIRESARLDQPFEVWIQ